MQDNERESIRQVLQGILDGKPTIVSSGKGEYDEVPSMFEAADAIQRSWLNAFEFAGLIRPDGDEFFPQDGSPHPHGRKAQKYLIVEGKEKEIRSLCS